MYPETFRVTFVPRYCENRKVRFTELLQFFFLRTDEQIPDKQILPRLLIDDSEFPAMLRIRSREAVEQKYLPTVHVPDHFVFYGTEGLSVDRAVDLSPVNKVMHAL